MVIVARGASRNVRIVRMYPLTVLFTFTMVIIINCILGLINYYQENFDYIFLKILLLRQIGECTSLEMRWKYQKMTFDLFCQYLHPYMNVMIIQPYSSCVK